MIKEHATAYWILADKFHEEKLVYLLNEIGVKQGKKFVFGWPVSHK